MIRDLIRRGAIFVINSSGGKDSQAMTIRLSKIIPKDQLVIVHAHLPEVEWEGSIEHIRETSLGIEVHVCQAVKTFFQMVDHRQKFPDKNNRQCTSDLKRGPIEKAIRKILKERNKYLVVSCVGMRAEESVGRAKLLPFVFYKAQSIAGREWYNWHPLLTKSTEWVFDTIHKNNQRAFWTYYSDGITPPQNPPITFETKGMSRKSCSFCILANQRDLKIAAKLRPDLADRYVKKEIEIGHTLQMSKKPLSDLIK